MAFRSGSWLFLLCAFAIGACRSNPAPAALPSPDTWARVNGRDITREEVDKVYQRTRDAAATPAPEELLLAQFSILDDLIVQELLLQQASTLKLEVAQSEIDTAEAETKTNMAQGAFEKELQQRGLTPADVREGLRRQLLAQKVIAQEVESKAIIGDQEVTDFFNANREQFNLAEESYRLAQIVVTPVPDAQVANATGDDATTPQAATAKVQMIMERLKSGTPFGELAAALSEDPESAPRGGDLGLVPVSRLQQAAPQLRNAVVGKAPGSVNVVTAGGAYTLVLVAAHEQPGQRDLSTPGVRDNIRETLRARKIQLLRAAYLTSLRNDARVEHFLAKSVVDAKGVPPPSARPQAAQ
jgi:parvulin-like peptidyl-prolyl isomerase